MCYRKSILQTLLIILIGIFFLSCSGSTEDLQNSDRDNTGGDGSDYADSADGDSSTDQPGSLDGDGQIDDTDSDDEGFDNDQIYPPMLSDPALLDWLFGEALQSQNIDYGESVFARFDIDRPFSPFTFDSLGGARITITLTLPSGIGEPALFLYGPRGKNGLWGDPIAADIATGGDSRAILFDFPILTEGLYLILATTTTPGIDEEFVLSLGCHNNCREPACPDMTCQQFCADGFLADPNGCASCYCDAGDCDCATDDDCPQDYYCAGCECIHDDSDIGSCECDALYDPVCGEDGVTYPNACTAECNRAAVVSSGECDPTDSEVCQFDSDCPPDLVCIAGVCALPADCECPDYYDPVCGADGITYDNPCLADCFAAGMAYAGACDPDINTSCKPVCATTQGASAWVDGCTGEVIGFQNCSGCDAYCAETGTRQEGWYSRCGDTLIMYADCGDTCNCPDIWSPVCGSNGETYPNRCEAECNNMTIAYTGECTDERTGCMDDSECAFNEVCVLQDECPPEDTEPCLYGVCMPAPENVECQRDSDCPEGMNCVFDGFAGTCVEIGENDCMRTGCHLEICAAGPISTQCRWQPEYACLDYAECRRLEDGSCGWLPTTNNYNSCMNRFLTGASCTVDSDCPGDYYCERAIAACLPADCVCEGDDPVCGTDGIVYPNPCTLNCTGARIAPDEFCQP